MSRPLTMPRFFERRPTIQFSADHKIPVYIKSEFMEYFFAFLPVLMVILLMMVFKWGSQYAGLAGWMACLIIAWIGFGLNWDVWLISQLKGVFLSFYVMLVIWPALFLYMLVNEMGGMHALVLSLENLLPQRDMLWLVLAWPFSGLVEGLTGFGLPIAIVAPMLVEMGMEPVIAVAAVAIGHAWAVTFGSMGLGLQTLGAVTQFDPGILAPPSAFLLAAGCLGCGLAVSRVLKQGRRWLMVIALALIMGIVYFGLTYIGLVSLSAFASGLTGTLVIIFWQRRSNHKRSQITFNHPDPIALKGALETYGFLIGLMLITGLIPPLHEVLYQVIWAPVFPQVTNNLGLLTPGGPVLVFRPLVFSGTMLFVAFLAGIFIFARLKLISSGAMQKTIANTWKAAAPTSAGILTMVGLSTLMEHCGMTQLLAKGLSQSLGAIFPIVSPWVGMLGTFTTGSNSNSNVLLAPLQKDVAMLLNLDPRWLVSAQTAGGSLGSMLAPAKLVVGCGTVGILGQDGMVLRRTLPYGLLIGLGVGLVTLVMVFAKF